MAVRRRLQETLFGVFFEVEARGGGKKKKKPQKNLPPGAPVFFFKTKKGGFSFPTLPALVSVFPPGGRDHRFKKSGPGRTQPNRDFPQFGH